MNLSYFLFVLENVAGREKLASLVMGEVSAIQKGHKSCTITRLMKDDHQQYLRLKQVSYCTLIIVSRITFKDVFRRGGTKIKIGLTAY